jgi:hypothetical protein
MTWERKILRKLYGPPYDNVYWRVKMNREIYNKFISPGILTVIKVCRLEWLGRVVRMDVKGQEISYWKGNQKEGRGGGGGEIRPSLRWMDVFELDLRNMGVKRWRTRTLHKTEWACVAREAKAKLKGL